VTQDDPKVSTLLRAQVQAEGFLVSYSSFSKVSQQVRGITLKSTAH
jgi:hypothetical protein